MRAFSASQENANEVCAEIAGDEYDEAPVVTCKFTSQGPALPGGASVHILELLLEDDSYGEIFLAYVVMHTEEEWAIYEQLGEAYEIPGESLEYSLGKPQHQGDRIRIKSTEIATTFDNTGDADADVDEEVERTTYLTTCSIRDGECEREEDDELID